METLQKKLEQIQDLVKQAAMSIKQPKAPSAPEAPTQQQANQPMKPTTPKTKKDPEKVAEQIKNPKIKDEAVQKAKKLKEGIKEKTVFNTRGQWKLDKIS
jgi:hypothetical protein